MKLDECVGNNIRKYRYACHMSLKELAAKIHKSISTISKYETGVISLDVTTLSELAAVFHISPAQLLSCAESSDRMNTAVDDPSEIRYVYFYDSVRKTFIKSVLERFHTEENAAVCQVHYFYDLQNLETPGRCTTLYTGKCVNSGFVETYLLHNRNTDAEYMQIICVDDLANPDYQIGLISGLSRHTLLPAANKAVISAHEIAKNNELLTQLLFTKDDLKCMKKRNSLTIEEASVYHSDTSGKFEFQA